MTNDMFTEYTVIVIYANKPTSIVEEEVLDYR